MERFHLSHSNNNNKKDSSLNGSQISTASHNGNNSSNKKWSFGRLFRRKKEIESESSSEEDRKAGFVPAAKYNRNAAAITSTPNKKTKSSKSASRGSKLMSGNFDHVVMSPTNTGNSSQNLSSSSVQHVDNEFFLPVETVPAQEPYYQNNPQQQAMGQTQQRLHHSQQYLPHVPQTQQQLMSRSAHSLDRRSARAKQRSSQKLPASAVATAALAGSSSEEEVISLNSTTFAKYRSDESIHSGGQTHTSNGQNRRSRAARNERYYKRLSRDGEVSHGQVPVMYAQQPTQRWKTQPVPLSIYQAPPKQPVPVQQPQQPQPQMRSTSSQNSQYSRLRNTNSLQHMAPYVQWGQMQQQQPKNLQNSVNDTKRSISYDSHIHLQNANGRLQNKPMPPPPPPRDPLRRVNVSGHMQDGSAGDLRPMSYAFDQTGVPVLPTSGLNGRCVSDDKIWAQQPHYQSIHSLNITPNQGNQATPSAPANRRFITRAERDAHPGKKSLPNGLEFHYVADATPRSRKPIHMLEPTKFNDDDDVGVNEPPSSGILRTTKSGLPTSPTKTNATEFWKRLEGSSQNINTPIPAPRGRDAQRSSVTDVSMKPRSVSSSRVGEMRAYPVPMYSEVYKPKNKTPTTSPSAQGQDEVDSVVCGSLHIKSNQDNANNSYVEIRNKEDNKTQSMPNHYNRRSGEIPTTPNKYEEYVNERREKHHNPLFDDVPQPPQRKLSGIPHIPQLSFPRKKPANLEEAINELEAIYRSLGLTEPEPEVLPKKERVPTPNDFEKYALAHADEYDDEDSPAGEPDPVRDDVAYRNIKLANLQHKTAEKQPPFGIPLGPIVPAAQTDYLHVTPKRKELVINESKAPDVIKDDLAVRALRKDPLENRNKFQYPTGSLVKKNRATRTQSANIYALIQRDAAKPSGGDLHSYLELTKSIDRSGSMSDIHKSESVSDIPSTLKLLQSLREQDKEKTQQQQQQPQQKKAALPFRHPSQGGAICQLPEKLSTSGAQEDSKPSKPVPLPRKSLTPEPQNTDTHKMEEALNKIAQDAQESSIKLTQELKELRKEALITASKPKKPSPEEERLVKELQEIEKVSQAAKKCGEMLLDTLPDNAAGNEGGEDLAKTRKLHKEDKLIKAIDQVSEAANKVCEKILKDIVTTEPPVVVQEAVKVTQRQKSMEPKPNKEDNLVMPTLIKKLDPINSTKIEAIARRCMRQLSDLADGHDYDNLNQTDIAVASTCNMKQAQITKDETTNDMNNSNLTEIRSKPLLSNNTKLLTKQQHQIEEIDQIMKECEDQAKQSQQQQHQQKGVPVVVTHVHQKQPPLPHTVMKAPGSSTTASSFSSSSDCLAKSSSPSGSRRFSSSITSFNPYSSSDYIKSPSSEFHAPSTDPIKTFSTTSYDVQSTTSLTPNLTTNSTFSYSPSPPPLNLTPISNCSATIASTTQRGRSSSPSQYNSSEELAMIFGIEEKSKAKKLQNNSGKNEDDVLKCANAKPELKLEHNDLQTNHDASLPECTANSNVVVDFERNCAKTNDCYMLLLNPNSLSHTNNNASSTPTSSTSSMSSSRLETIPELGVACQQEYREDTVKLSANFNKIYASKLSIFVDKLSEEQAAMTQFDSLSSLEETSSNPDSGNVSLADFPLQQQNLNVSLQLSANYNTRFEYRKSFKTEITIGEQIEREGSEELVETEEEAEDYQEFSRLPLAEEEEEEFPRLPSAEEYKEFSRLPSAEEEEEFPRLLSAEEEEEFPRLPTAEELEESLKERFSLEESFKKTEELLDEQIVLKEKLALAKEDHELMGERIIWARDEIMAEVKALEEKALKERLENEKDIKIELEEELEEEKEDEEEVEEEFEKEQADEEELEEEDESLKENYDSLKLDIMENLTAEEKAVEKPLRKHSICIETPQLEMNIMEERFNYEISVNRESCHKEDEEDLLKYQELAQECQDLEKELKKEFETPEESKKQPENQTPLTNELRMRVWQSQTSEEMPSTSSKAENNMVVNVLGEQRQAVNSLTLLEHLVVACTLGIINTDDLFTLCLIIIGILIVIAIALF